MKTARIERIIARIPQLKQCRKFYRLNKGWSSDKKYFIEVLNGRRYLLRLNASEKLAAKKEEYLMMKQGYELGMRMSEPLEFGTCNNRQNVYILLSWIDGTPLDVKISLLSPKKQYDFGIEAGKILKKFHSIPAPADQPDWENRMIKKFAWHLDKYRSSGIKIRNDNKAVQYVRDNLHLLKNRPQVFQHGDFHTGNLILTVSDYSRNSLVNQDYQKPGEKPLKSKEEKQAHKSEISEPEKPELKNPELDRLEHDKLDLEKPAYQKCSGKSLDSANQQTLAVIDFNRWDFGDPYEEFYKMMLFSREQSIPFARGQIQGYFSGEIPEDFFPTLALYLADVILYSVVWAVSFGEEEINRMIKLAEMILADFDSFSSKIPGWW